MYGYIVISGGKAMLFEVRGGKVVNPSPQMPHVRGWTVPRLRGYFKMHRCVVYAVARQSG
jgi:hypothetical protein